MHPPGPHGGHGPQPLDLARPRILGAGADLAAVAARRTASRTGPSSPGSSTEAPRLERRRARRRPIGAERTKAKAAKDLAFQYAIDRTVVDGVPAPFRDAAERQAAGDTARTCCSTCTRAAAWRCRRRSADTTATSTPPKSCSSTRPPTTRCSAPTTRSARDEAAIRTRITDLASELYDDYINPDHAGGRTRRPAEQPPVEVRGGAGGRGARVARLRHRRRAHRRPTSAPRRRGSTSRSTRWTSSRGGRSTTADGAYGEGPYYQRYAAQNLLPFARAWNHAEPRPALGRRRPTWSPISGPALGTARPSGGWST